MKKRLTRGEKWLFASPLLFLVIAGVFWQIKGVAPRSIELPATVKVRQVRFSPEGRQLAVLDYNYTSRQFEGQINGLVSPAEICNLQMPRILDEENHVGVPVWSPDKKSLAVRFRSYASPNFVSRILIWDAKNGLLKFDHRYLSRVGDMPDRNFFFSKDGKTLSGEGLPPLSFDVASGRRLDKPVKSANLIAKIDEYADVNQKLGLATVRMYPEKNTLSVLDARTGRSVWKLKREELQESQWNNEILCLCYNADTGSGTRPVQNNLVLWNGKTRRLMPAPPVPFWAEISEFCFNPDGRSLAYFTHLYDRNVPAGFSGQRGGGAIIKSQMTVWDYRANRVLTRASISSIPTYLQWSPDGKRLAGVDRKLYNGVVVFDKSGQLRLNLPKNDEPFCWSSDSKQLASSVRKLINGESVKTKRVEIHRFAD